jgi:coenzyme F420 hydrogenase subunit beta
MDSETAIGEEQFTTKAESGFFGRQRKPDEAFGVYRRFAIAQTTSPEVARVCQDGGVATTLLLFALGKGIIDAALVAGALPEDKFHPVPRLVSTTEEILEAAGSKYTCSQNPITLASEAAKQGKTKVAFVGTPCQVQALRRLQLADPSKLGFVKFSAGLMCSGCFTKELITDLVQKKLGIDPGSIVKMNIKGKLLITTTAGVTEVPLSEANLYKREGCGACHDFSSELADVSIGGLGLDGWTFTVIRSEKGEELFTNATEAGFLRTRPVGAEDSALRLLVRLSRKKHEHLAT